MNNYKKQNGAVLLLSLVFLIILTLLAVSSMNTVVTETLLASNSKKNNQALQVTETGLLPSWYIITSEEPEITKILDDLTKYIDYNLKDLPDAFAKFTINKGNDDEITSEVTESKIVYKGGFNQPYSSAANAYGNNVKKVYFETSTIGLANKDSQGFRTKLRSGIRQNAP
jgi:hypothetical protein